MFTTIKLYEYIYMDIKTRSVSFDKYCCVCQSDYYYKIN